MKRYAQQSFNPTLFPVAHLERKVCSAELPQSGFRIQQA
jgi:hypothetical protein